MSSLSWNGVTPGSTYTDRWLHCKQVYSAMRQHYIYVPTWAKGVADTCSPRWMRDYI